MLNTSGNTEYKMSYYKPSGKFNLILTIPGVLVGVLLSIALAYLYILLGSWISFIIVKFCLLAGAIYMTLEITKLSNRIAKNRNKLITYFSVFVFSLTLLYFSWFFFVVLELEQTFSQTFYGLWHYVELLLNMQEYEVTTPLEWFTETVKGPVSPWETYVILGGESLILAFGGIIAVKINQFDTMLFCENCNVWAKKCKTIKKKYNRVFTTPQLEKMVDDKDLSPILSLPDANVEKKIAYLIYEINQYCCPNCNETNFIKIKRDNTKLTKDKTHKTEVLLNYYKLEDANLLDDFENNTLKT